MKKRLLTALLAAASPVFAAGNAAGTARNKENALAFYELAFNKHQLQEAVDKYS